MNKLELKADIARRGMSGVSLSRELGVSESTFFRKLGGHADFTLSEVQDIIRILDLDQTRINDIFFSNGLS